MIAHNTNISKDISLNIIGTSNIVFCEQLNIKLIYFSTSYVYPGKKGNYKESDPLLPCKITHGLNCGESPSKCIKIR